MIVTDANNRTHYSQHKVSEPQRKYNAKQSNNEKERGKKILATEKIWAVTSIETSFSADTVIIPCACVCVCILVLFFPFWFDALFSISLCVSFYFFISDYLFHLKWAHSLSMFSSNVILLLCVVFVCVWIRIFYCASGKRVLVMHNLHKAKTQCETKMRAIFEK